MDEDWSIAITPAQLEFEAMRICLEDLKEAAAERGIAISIGTDEKNSQIIVGAPSRNPAASELDGIKLVEIEDPQGYEIATLGDHKKVIVVTGGSPIGDVYGVYRIWDGIRIHGRIPELNVREKPALEIRYTRIRVNDEDDIRRALRYRLNMVFGDNPLKLIDWDSEPERSENVENRAKAKRLAEYAHSVGMKFLTFGTDFTYHPSLLEKHGARLSPCDEGLWDAVRAKYRKLLRELPELDGVSTFTADEQDYWGAYRTFDVMHDGEGCDWSLEKRYRTFVKAVWDVVVGEFGKLLVHRTWVTTSYEQQSQAEVYERIFTNDVPTENLYLVPSFTQNDRWWFQAYNPTFNRTSHDMMVVCESMDYHDAGGNFFLSYPGRYFQAGLEWILGGGRSNLKGGSLDLPSKEGWDTRSLTAYTLTRMFWNPREDPEKIARDFSSIFLGEEIGDRISEILLLSPVAYKYGLYIEPFAYGEFSSLAHIRTGRFIAEGYPSIDGGRDHVEFLREIYLRCKPWMEETLQYLDHGLRTAREMEERFASIKSQIHDGDLAIRVENSLRLTRLLIETNNLYVKTTFDYFGYRENPSDETRKALERVADELDKTSKRFSDAPGYNFQQFGVEQLIKNAKLVLFDLQRAEDILTSTPSTEEIEDSVRMQQRRHREVLQDRTDLVKILYWEGRVDGRDILVVRGGDISIKHLRWDGIYIKNHEFFEPLPEKTGTVVIEDLESEPMHPFVLQHPSESNDFTAKVYLYDVPGGAHWMKFNLYFLEERPDEMGLDTPWKPMEDSS
jgi:hypothetical protein